MKETQETIAAWADETFGAADSLARVAARANEEMAELLRAITANKPAAVIIEEAADTAIVLDGRITSFGFGGARDRARNINLLDEVVDLSDPFCLAIFANVNLAALMEALAEGYSDRVQRGAIDMVYAGLFWLAAALGGDLDKAIDAKMVINRARTWRNDGTGHGYHKRAG